MKMLPGSCAFGYMINKVTLEGKGESIASGMVRREGAKIDGDDLMKKEGRLTPHKSSNGGGSE